MKTLKKMILCLSMVWMLMFMGSTVFAATTYGYLNKSVNYNTKSCDIRYHAVEPTKFTITAAVAGTTPVTTIRIYNYTTKKYKNFSAESSYWSYNAEKNISVFACNLTMSATGDMRFAIVKDAAENGRPIAVNVKGSIETKPANVKATAATTSVINVTWDKIPGVTGYNVYRSTSKNGTYTKLGNVTTNACKVSGLKKGTSYYYKVRGYYKKGNEVLYSKWSSIVGAKTLSTPVYTNALVELKADKVYKKYDLTCDGVADTFKYTLEAGKAKIYLGGKYKQSLDLLRGGWLYFCSVDKANTYLIAICGQYHGQTFQVYKYAGGTFKQVESSVPYANYMLDYSKPIKISNNILTINTTPCTTAADTMGNGGYFKSFANVNLKDKYSMGYNVQFKLSGGKMTLYSRLFEVTGRVGYYAKNSFKTSLSYNKMSVKDGPIVTQGQKVTVKKFYVAGTKVSEGKNYFLIEVNGKTAWFADSSYILLGI